MTTQNEPRDNRQMILLAVAVLVLAGLLVGLGRHYLGNQGPSVAQEMDLDKHPIPSWVADDAKKCKGDIAQLDLAEQQKVYAAYPGQGGKAIIAAAYATQH